MKQLLRTAAIHDLTGFGRCALSVITPILSVFGIQTCPLPTGILPTHPAGFTKPPVTSFYPQIAEFLRHWEENQITFDCISTGFFADVRQIPLVLDWIRKSRAKTSCLTVVDPVFADHGRLYSTMKQEIISHLKLLCKEADLITPNYTEACFLTDTAPKDTLTEKELTQLVKQLSFCCPNQFVITSLPMETEKVTTVYYDGKQTGFLTQDRIPENYPGTGDIFTATLTGALLSGISFSNAVRLAAGFTGHLVKKAYEWNLPNREGVPLESELRWLINKRKDFEG